jgi:tRNA(Ile)-lysidine synthase TilS/MesJ
VNARAILLLSGGLDSLLAVEVLLRAGIEVIGLHHKTVFYPGGTDLDDKVRCRVITRDISEEMLALVRAPQHGFGKNANPCLDCKQMMYGLAWAEAERQAAQFIATGEVLGQRPMSQHRGAFNMMERHAGVKGRVVRPLCAQLLEPTLAEQAGLYRREDMLDISGRSRKRQMALAAEWGITEYPSPAGGCKLTDPNYSQRLFRLREKGHLELDALRAARHGRMLDLAGADAFLLVGRNDADNNALLADAPEGARILEMADVPGPLGCIIGEVNDEQLAEACRFVVSYSRFKDSPPESVLVMSVAEARERG